MVPTTCGLSGTGDQQGGKLVHQLGQRAHLPRAHQRALFGHVGFQIPAQQSLDRAQVMNLLRDIQDRLGVSYLFIAHDLAVVKYVSTRIGVSVSRPKP